MRRFRLLPMWALAAGLALPGLGWAAEPLVEEAPPCCRKTLEAGEPTGASLYQLDSIWTSDVGKQVRLGVFRGRTQVVSFFFANCAYACPITVEEMKRIEAALPEELRAKVDFILVTLDPERDTVEALARYRAQRQLGVGHWSLLRGGADDTRELAALLGVSYKRDGKGQFAHSNLISILNREGEVSGRLVGLHQDIPLAVEAVRKAAAE